MTRHLTDCWYPGADDAEVRELARGLNRPDRPGIRWISCEEALLCADALERMAGPLEETT